MEKGKQPPKEELLPESPATKALVEQWETLRVQDSVLQKGWEDAATQERTLLLVVPLSLRAELLEEAHAGVSGGHQGRKKTLPSAPTPVLGQYEMGCGGTVETVPCMCRQERTGVAHMSTIAAVTVWRSHGEGSGGYCGATAVYAPR